SVLKGCKQPRRGVRPIATDLSPLAGLDSSLIPPPSADALGYILPRLRRWATAQALKSKQSRHFDHEGSIAQTDTVRASVALVRPDDEEFASRPIFPAIPEVAAECPIGGVVLEKGAREHSR